MDCPHCGEENLLGVVNCMACGKSMFSMENMGVSAEPSMPSPSASAASSVDRRDAAPPFPNPEPPPGSASQDEGGARCRVCLEPFERPSNDPLASTCASCSNFAKGGGDFGENQVQLAYSPEVHDEYASRLGDKSLRPAREMKLKMGVRKGRVAVIVALFLILATVAVVYLMPESDHTAVYFTDVRPEEANLQVAPTQDRLLKFQTDLNLRILREQMKASFVGDLVPKLDMRQDSQHLQELLFARKAPRGVVVDLHTENLLVRQEGRDGKRNAAELRAYPWVGRTSTHKALLSIHAPASTETGSRLSSNVDVTPLLTLAAVNAPDAVIPAGKRWLADLRLPVMATSSGVLFNVDFPFRVEYLGRKLIAGHDCIALKVTSRGLRQVPKKYENMNRTGGQLAGALFYDSTSGLIVEGHLDVDVYVARDRGRLEEKIRVVGQMHIARR